MKTTAFKLDKGSVYTTFVLSPDELTAAGSSQGAIQAALDALTVEHNLPALIYTRVTAMNELDDGSLEVTADAAIPPEVILGPYLGVEVDMGHNEDFAEAAVMAAAKNLRMVVPEVLIQRKIDAAMLENETALLDSLSLNTLADVRAIIAELNDKLTLCLDENTIWGKAMQAAENYIGMGMQDIGAFAQAFEGVIAADGEAVVRAAERRAYARGELSAEQIADEVFEAWLHTENLTREQWREAQRESAELVCRVDFLLAAVADEEGLTADEGEIESAARTLAAQYMMNPEDILAAVGEESIRHHIRISKANQIIVENAKNK